MIEIATTRAGNAGRAGPGVGLADLLFGGTAMALALLVLLLLGGVVVALMIGSMEAFRTFGPGFLVSSDWNPVTGRFGALAPVFGSIVTAAIAMLVALPLSFGIALFLTEMCPPWLKRPVGTAIELLAAIPSIIFGMWGLFVLVPIMQQVIQPALIAVLGPLPLIGVLFSGPPIGIGVLTAGIILALMVLPYITAVTRDVFETVPPRLRESAYAMGATTTEVVWHVILPYSRVGVVGGVMLGLGRALGETMAVTFVIGNAIRLSDSLMAPGATIASALASQFAEAYDPLYQSSLIALGLILFLLTFAVLAYAKTRLLRLQRKAGG